MIANDVNRRNTPPIQCAKTSGSTRSVGLWDAFEGHVLGEYVEVVDKQGQPSISLCFLKPPDAPLGTEARQCHSKIEWQNMVREHMGSGAME